MRTGRNMRFPYDLEDVHEVLSWLLLIVVKIWAKPNADSWMQRRSRRLWLRISHPFIKRRENRLALWRRKSTAERPKQKHNAASLKPSSTAYPSHSTQ